jgi:septum formation protein
MPDPHPVILASNSSIRAQMLRVNGVPFTQEPARVDEDALKRALLAENAPMRDIADQLAEVKAVKVSSRNPGAFVIGADQILVHEGALISKAETLDEAADTLRRLRGSSHLLLSACVVAEDGKPIWRHIGQARLTMHDFSEDFLEAYLAQNGAGLLATVGGYKVEEGGASLFTGIQGDYFSVLGMPLLELLAFLRLRGIMPQ